MRSSKLFAALIKNSISLVKNYDIKQPLEAQCHQQKIVKVLNELQLDQLQFKQSSAITEGIGVRNIFEYGPMRLTLYYLPQGQIMKLHDHPKMQVISYVLQGKLEAKIYTQVKAGLYNKETSVLENQAVRFIDGLRTNKDNLHQFRAIESSFFIDIIFPDYNQRDRQCTYFEEEEQIGQGSFKLKELRNYNEADCYEI